MKPSYCRVDVESNSLYTKTEFDSLSGYVTGQYTSEWQDKDGTKWRTITQIINLGRPDRGVYCDPDAMIETVEADGELHVAVESRLQREAKLAIDIKALFERRGPMSAPRIAAILNGNKTVILRVLRDDPATFAFLGGQYSVWGLHGQTFVPVKTRKITPLMLAIRDAILAYGPQSAPELAKRLNSEQTVIHHSMRARAEWFAVAETRKAKGSMPATRVWGLTDAGKAGAK